MTMTIHMSDRRHPHALHDYTVWVVSRIIIEVAPLRLWSVAVKSGLDLGDVGGQIIWSE